MSETGTPAPPTTAKGVTTTVELTRAQAQIARRTAESRAIVPDLTLRTRVDLGALAPAPGAPITAHVVRACALALREHEAVAGAYRDAALERYSRVNVGVGVEGPGVLLAPTIFDADTKDAARIAGELAALTARVHAGEITQPELSGATFTVTDVGAHAVDGITPMIVPPQAAALGVGAVRDRVLAVDGAPAVRPAVDLTLVCDHRAVYPAQAAAFLARVAALLGATASA